MEISQTLKTAQRLTQLARELDGCTSTVARSLLTEQIVNLSLTIQHDLQTASAEEVPKS